MSSGGWIVGGSQYDFGASKSWTGGDSPRGRRNRRYPNAYTMTSQRFTQSKSTLVSNNGTNVGSAYIYNVVAQLRQPSVNLSLAALGQVSEQIRGHSFNAAIFAAEGLQSLTTIKQTAYAVLRAAHYTARGNYVQAVRSLGRIPGQQKATKRAFNKAVDAKDFSGAWLSIQYGWRPLLQDLYEAMKAYEGRYSSPRSLTFRATKSDEDFVDYLSLRYEGGVVRARRRCSVTYVVTLYETVGSLRALGLTNPSSVVWEKIPFSFVADWFIPIGNYLSELSFFSGLKTSYTCSSFSRMDVFVKARGSRSDASWPASRPIGGDYKNTQIRFERSVGSSINVPRPEPKALAKAFSLGHLKNSAALIHQMAAGRFTFKATHYTE